MSIQAKNKMHLFRRVFWILLGLDLIGLILAGVALFPTFALLTGYGRIMAVVASVITAVFLAAMLFGILVKGLLIRSTSPKFSWASDRKGYVFAAKLLVLFDFAAVILDLLSAGGEGATLLNQGYLYLQVLGSVVEMITIVLYLRTVKKLFAA